MKKVFCFGELLLRMSPPQDVSWIEQASMPTYLGGAELNVSKALTKWGVPVKYVTALPDNMLSEQIIAHLTEKGIDTSGIHASGDRIGIYYMAQGADLKNAGVVYDRSNSSFSCLKRGMLDWDTLLQDVDWFHFSAITPALSAGIADVCLEGLEAAAARNIPVSVDLNYRAKLWKYGKAPHEIMPELVKHCDIVMGNVWAASIMLGTPIDEQVISDNTQEQYLRQAAKTSIAIQSRYPKCKIVANTYRFSDQDEINYYATLYADDQLFHSATYDSDAVIDKSGSGDCFMAGLIYTLREHQGYQDVINFATSAAFTKLFVPGDATDVSVNEIKNKIKK